MWKSKFFAALSGIVGNSQKNIHGLKVTFLS